MRVDNQTLSLDPFLIQRSPNGREFKVVGVEKDLSMDPIWSGGIEKFYWIVTVKLLDDNSRVKFFFNSNDECVRKEKMSKGYQINLLVK